MSDGLVNNISNPIHSWTYPDPDVPTQPTTVVIEQSDGSLQESTHYDFNAAKETLGLMNESGVNAKIG